MNRDAPLTCNKSMTDTLPLLWDRGTKGGLVLETLLEASDPGVDLIDADILVDTPWLTVARVRYSNGTRYDIVWCEATEPEEFDMFYLDILPLFSIRLHVRATETLPDTLFERTCSYWVME